MKARGFKKGMLQISVGKKYDLKDAIKKALGVNTDRTADAYIAGKWAVSGDKYKAVNKAFAKFGITEWQDVIEEESMCSDK